MYIYINTLIYIKCILYTVYYIYIYIIMYTIYCIYYVDVYIYMCVWERVCACKNSPVKIGTWSFSLTASLREITRDGVTLGDSHIFSEPHCQYFGFTSVVEWFNDLPRATQPARWARWQSREADASPTVNDGQENSCTGCSTSHSSEAEASPKKGIA